MQRIAPMLWQITQVASSRQRRPKPERGQHQLVAAPSALMYARNERCIVDAPQPPAEGGILLPTKVWLCQLHDNVSASWRCLHSCMERRHGRKCTPLDPPVYMCNYLCIKKLSIQHDMPLYLYFARPINIHYKVPTKYMQNGNHHVDVCR